MADDLLRRDFMKQTGAAALLSAPAVQSARGANDKVNIGWIGLGTRGYYCLEKMYTGNAKNVHVGAVCDTSQGTWRAARIACRLRKAKRPRRSTTIARFWPTSPST